MCQPTSATLRGYRLGFSSLLLASLLALAGNFSSAAADKKPEPETIRATAMGTGMQMGQDANVTLIIFHYSTPEDKQALLQAFHSRRARIKG